MVASERDFAMTQLKEMAEQVQTVAEEFKSMSEHSDQILKELDQASGETLASAGRERVYCVCFVIFGSCRF